MRPSVWFNTLAWHSSKQLLLVLDNVSPMSALGMVQSFLPLLLQRRSRSIGLRLWLSIVSSASLLWRPVWNTDSCRRRSCAALSIERSPFSRWHSLKVSLVLPLGLGKEMDEICLQFLIHMMGSGCQKSEI